MGENNALTKSMFIIRITQTDVDREVRGEEREGEIRIFSALRCNEEIFSEL